MYGKEIVLVLMITFVNSKELPTYLRSLRCSIKLRNEFEACFVKSANLAIPLIARGDPEYHIPKMNPLEVPFMQLISTPTLSLNITNLTIHGLEKMKLASLHVDWKRALYTLEMKSQDLTIEGQYSVNGHILIMPIQGYGNFSIHLMNGNFEAKTKSTTYQKNGDTYFKSLGTELNYKFQNMKFKLDNLFDGNEELGAQVNKFLNENWELLLVDFGPGITNTITSVITDIYDKFNNVIPAKNIFFW